MSDFKNIGFGKPSEMHKREKDLQLRDRILILGDILSIFKIEIDSLSSEIKKVDDKGSWQFHSLMGRQMALREMRDKMVYIFGLRDDGKGR